VRTTLYFTVENLRAPVKSKVTSRRNNEFRYYAAVFQRATGFDNCTFPPGQVTGRGLALRHS
jgi:hypothetical protein